MRIPCFTITSLILRIKKEPFSFEPISQIKCKELMNSYPNGLTRENVNDIFEKTHTKHYFKRGSNVFMLDLNEKNNSVILHDIISNDNDPSSFMNSYKHLVDKVHLEKAIFVDNR